MGRTAVINNISFIGRDQEWRSRTFLPLYDRDLIWADNAKCDGCKLASRCHPMVQDDEDENCFHKLCTLTVIKAKLIKVNEIL